MQVDKPTQELTQNQKLEKAKKIKMEKKAQRLRGFASETDHSSQYTSDVNSQNSSCISFSSIISNK
jgi:hypothetical protein